MLSSASRTHEFLPGLPGAYAPGFRLLSASRTAQTLEKFTDSQLRSVKYVITLIWDYSRP